MRTSTRPVSMQRDEYIKKNMPYFLQPGSQRSLFFFVICMTALMISCVRKPAPASPPAPVQQETGSSSAPSSHLPSSPNSPPSNMTTLKVAVNKAIQIQFEDQEMADYVWYYHVSEDWIISMTEPYDYPAKSAAPSENTNGRFKVYDVKGLKKGVVTIRFYKVKPWESDAKPVDERYYRVEVTD